MPALTTTDNKYEAANKAALPVLGKVSLDIALKTPSFTTLKRCLNFNVTSFPHLNLLGRNDLPKLEISLDKCLLENQVQLIYKVFDHLKTDAALQRDCEQMCDEFPNLFKPDLGRMKDFQLEVRFKPEVTPKFNRPRSVPVAVEEDLADAYNQIPLAPESQKRLALSTHKGVLLQKVLPFGISSVPGYFQEIMDKLTADLPGVAVYLDDLLVSGNTAQEHRDNLHRLLSRLDEKNLRCRREKCSFGQPSVEYLGHLLASEGIAKGAKVEAVLHMPPPSDISTLRSFMGQVQFYSKFLKNLSTVAEPLYALTKKDAKWD